jgi:hypothetical protein
MRKENCGYGWKKKFWVEGNLESIVAVSEATTALERTQHLLARIHGDGGHHTEAVGIMQSIADAEKRVIELRAELDNSLQAEQKLKELLARIHRDGGQYTDEVGLQRSCDDADTVLVAWREAFDAEADWKTLFNNFTEQQA